MNRILDPRGEQERPVIKLAQRPSIEELKKGKVLFYNNTKLGFCNYYTVFDRIKEHLTEPVSYTHLDVYKRQRFS